MSSSSGDGYSSAAGGDQPTMTPAVLATIVGSASLFMFLSGPFLVRAIAWILGWILRLRTSGRRAHLVALMDEDEVKLPKETPHSDLGAKDAQQGWDGIVGFFHPFCNAGGGGERVLWAAIRATQNRWPRAKCVVYTGDHDVNKNAILQRVQSRFNIHLHPPAVTFLYLSKRNWVLASTWPRFTLLGQSLGSMVLAWDALSLLVPDIFVDTMGYAFALGLCKFLFRNMPTGAYVHYPTISTDMLDSLDPTSTVGSQGINAGQGKGARGQVKKAYWRLFARLYCWVGSSIDVVMTNSTWTQSHIQALWGPRRSHKGGGASSISVVYPPVAVREVIQKTGLSEASEKKREKVLLCIAQFRPEKNHTLILQSFADFLKTKSNASDNARLTLIGSVRDDQDSKMIYQLRLLANELGIKDRVEFHLDVPWPQILEWLGKASVGVNGMWNEHFGIGVVEYQAAGLISVVHNSGGPKLDIVTSIEGEATGFYATTAQEFAAAFEKALSLDNPLAARKRARASAMRFTEEEFSKNWQVQMGQLVAMRK